MTVISKFLERKKKVSLKIYENGSRMCWICKTHKKVRDRVANGREKHSVLPARSDRISRRQKYRKVGKDQTQKQQRVKKSIGCHGEKE